MSIPTQLTTAGFQMRSLAKRQQCCDNASPLTLSIKCIHQHKPLGINKPSALIPCCARLRERNGERVACTTLSHTHRVRLGLHFHYVSLNKLLLRLPPTFLQLTIWFVHTTCTHAHENFDHSFIGEFQHLRLNPQLETATTCNVHSTRHAFIL